MVMRQTVNEKPKDGQGCGSTEVELDLSAQESGDAKCRRLNNAPPSIGRSHSNPRTWDYIPLHGKGSLQTL